jgi:hypothetical protein
LTNTFIQIQGIGAIAEKRLWESGIRNWEAFSGNFPIPIPARRNYFLEQGIEESKNIRSPFLDLGFIEGQTNCFKNRSEKLFAFSKIFLKIYNLFFWR